MNVLKLIISGFVLITLSCCESDSLVYKETQPKDLIDLKTFKKIYSELLLIESTARVTSESGLKADSMVLTNCDNFLKKKNITRIRYNTSYNYYAMNAEKFIELNSAIKLELEEKLKKVSIPK